MSRQRTRMLSELEPLHPSRSVLDLVSLLVGALLLVLLFAACFQLLELRVGDTAISERRSVNGGFIANNGSTH